MYPTRPERVCWGCERLCPANDLACGNGSERTPHPIELFGEDWAEFAEENAAAADLAPSAAPRSEAIETARGKPQIRPGQTAHDAQAAGETIECPSASSWSPSAGDC